MMKEKLLSWLLSKANSHPHWSHDFYQIKDMILRRHGLHLGEEIQHIKKECFTCKGTGIYEGREYCRRCLGDGIYSEFCSVLGIYEIGGREFHLPVKRIHYYQEEFRLALLGTTIHGYIDHDWVEGGLESEFLLYLIYDRSKLWKHLGHIGTRWRWFTPLTNISSAIMTFKFEVRPAIVGCVRNFWKWYRTGAYKGDYIEYCWGYEDGDIPF